MFQSGSKFLNSQIVFLGVLMLGFCMSLGHAAPPPQSPTLQKRYSVSQRGDFALIGNTLGFDCRSTVPDPVVGTVDRHHCETHPPANPSLPNTTNDSAIDVLFQVDHPSVGLVQADIGVTPALASSEAVLQLPEGALVTYARLYWSATLTNSVTSYSTVTLSRQYVSTTNPGFHSNLTADTAHEINTVQQADNTFGFAYQASVDVTDLVTHNGSGAYQVSNVTMMSPVDATLNSNYAAWSLVVLYQLPTGPTRQVTIFDGLNEVSDARYPSVTVGISGFLVPNDAGYDAKFGTIVYEGDDDLPGDGLQVNGQPLSDALNAQTNFFNGTRSWLGTPISVTGDLPQLRGTKNSMMGLDLDVIDIKNAVHSGDTQATLKATTTEDTFFLGAFITSISTLVPDFSDMPKTFHNTTGPDDKIKRGDTVEYTIVVKNEGSDQAVNTVLTDPLPNKVTYVLGSLCIVNALTCAPVNSTQGGYDAASNTITVRLGTGFTATQGGSIEVDAAPITLKFKVTINSDANGIVSNQASISCNGAQSQSLPPWIFASGNGVSKNTPTTFPVFICDQNSDCPQNELPFCDTSSTVHFCTDVCQVDGDCTKAHGPNWVCQGNNSSLPKHCVPTADLGVFVNVSDVNDDNQVTYDLQAGNFGPGVAPSAIVTYQIPPNTVILALNSSNGWTCATAINSVVCTIQKPFELGMQAVAEIVVQGPLVEPALPFNATIQPVGIGDPNMANNAIHLSTPLKQYSLQGGGFGFNCNASPSTRSSSSIPTILLGIAGCALAYFARRQKLG